ncbi:NAD(P)H-dependent oxidoreductase subunit E [Candidatus Nomurabacteria bacterium]|nr:NAD(P)H-dependent oxidoreductase subunit E [Candidatus Nomurabacteria bacterium]
MKRVEVCCGKSCTSMGSRDLLLFLQEKLGLKPGQNDGTIELDTTPCTGYCSLSPNVRVNDDHFVHQAEKATILKKIEQGGIKREAQILDFSDDFLDDLRDL